MATRHKKGLNYPKAKPLKAKRLTVNGKLSHVYPRHSSGVKWDRHPFNLYHICLMENRHQILETRTPMAAWLGKAKDAPPASCLHCCYCCQRPTGLDCMNCLHYYCCPTAATNNELAAQGEEKAPAPTHWGQVYYSLIFKICKRLQKSSYKFLFVVRIQPFSIFLISKSILAITLIW